jgi:hypothetical protein
MLSEARIDVTGAHLPQHSEEGWREKPAARIQAGDEN